MLKFYNYDIVCQEIPDEITLAVNISGCPNRCQGCHSPWLWNDEGEELDKQHLTYLIERYKNAITCVCFMGGDNDPKQVEILSEFVHSAWPKIKTGWYSGKTEIPVTIDATTFDFIKLGPYIEALGGLRSATTNQKLYKLTKENKKTEYTDITKELNHHL